MKLEQQVCSLHLSKKLRELGVKQESLFCWAEDQLGDEKTEIQYVHNILMDEVYAWKFFSAFTVAELGEILPEVSSGTQLETWKFKNQWTCGNERHRESADTEADARAKMLCYLLENKLMAATAS